MLNQPLASLVIRAIERGMVPDRVTRFLVRRLCRSRLLQVAKDDEHAGQHGLSDFADQMRCGPVAPLPEKANDQHYELPAEFFQEMLGPHLKYSCCFFERDDASLAEAEAESLRLTCRHAEIQDGMNVLETGCGWGSLTIWMLEQFPALRVTAVSNSSRQRVFIRQRAEAAGVANRLTVITADMNDFSPGEARFERIVSCEMFEHMRNYEVLLQRMAGWLKSEGKLFIHIFCHRKFAYEFESSGSTNWMGRHFFSGGIMPGLNLLREFDHHLQVTQQWQWDGTHYQRTCNEWLKRLDQNRDSAIKILERQHGPDEATVRLNRWRLFLVAGAELFGYEQGQQWLVGHFLMEPVTGKTPAAPVRFRSDRDPIAVQTD